MSDWWGVIIQTCSHKAYFTPNCSYLLYTESNSKQPQSTYNSAFLYKALFRKVPDRCQIFFPPSQPITIKSNRGIHVSPNNKKKRGKIGHCNNWAKLRGRAEGSHTIGRQVAENVKSKQFQLSIFILRYKCLAFALERELALKRGHLMKNRKKKNWFARDRLQSWEHGKIIFGLDKKDLMDKDVTIITF